MHQLERYREPIGAIIAQIAQALLSLDPLWSAILILVGIVLFSAGIRHSNTAVNRSWRDSAWIGLGALLIILGLIPLAWLLIGLLPSFGPSIRSS